MAESKKSRKTIHKWAVASALTAGALPVGADAAALFGEECLMYINVAAMFGHHISLDTAAEALTTGTLGTVVGTAVFEGLDVGYPFTIPAKVAVATAVMEGLGHAAYTLFESAA